MLMKSSLFSLTQLNQRVKIIMISMPFSISMVVGGRHSSVVKRLKSDLTTR